MMIYKIAKIIRYIIGEEVRPPMSVYKITREIAAIKPPIITHGLNLPHLVFVLSIVLPMNGSMKSSATRITRITVVIVAIIHSSCAWSPELNRLLVMNMMKYVLTIMKNIS